MRLTSELLLHADHYLNPMKEREIFLRGFKIPGIENFGVLQDQFDSVDLSDNEIKKIDNFPKMNRCVTLLMNNNYVSKISASLGSTQLVNLRTLVLANNRIISFTEIENLASCKKLESLTLLDNPILSKRFYRLYVIFKIETLKMLDFQKVSKKEREEAIKFFSSKEGLAYLSSEKVSDSSAKDSSVSSSSVAMGSSISADQKEYIRELISKANSIEEIESIEARLRDGTIEFPDHVMGDSMMET